MRKSGLDLRCVKTSFSESSKGSNTKRKKKQQTYFLLFLVLLLVWRGALCRLLHLTCVGNSAALSQQLAL